MGPTLAQPAVNGEHHRLCSLFNQGRVFMKRYVLTISGTTLFLFALLGGNPSPTLAQTQDGQVDLTLSSTGGNIANTNQVNGSLSGNTANTNQVNGSTSGNIAN